MIKLFEQFNNEQEIREICEKYNIENYTINSDGSIDVDGDVDLSWRGTLERLPLIFNKVKGGFYCNVNKLTSLKGCPKEVGDTFNCSENLLTSLEGCPIKVGGSFYCNVNKLTSLKGCPIKVDGYFDCSVNSLTSLRDCPKKVTYFFKCSKIKLQNTKTKIKNKNKNMQNNDILKELENSNDFLSDLLKIQELNFNSQENKIKYNYELIFTEKEEIKEKQNIFLS